MIRMANLTIEQKSNVILDAIRQRYAFDALGGRIHQGRRRENPLPIGHAWGHPARLFPMICTRWIRGAG